MAESPDAPVAEGRTAAGDHEWQRAYDAFTAAGGARSIPDEDLEAYWTAAYLVGDVASAVDALTRRYRTAQEAGDTAAAVLAGGWAVFMLTMHGATAQTGGWLSRLEPAAAGLPEDDRARWHLRCLEAFRSTAMERDYAAGHEAASEVIVAARRHDDHDLLALALNVDARALVRAGHIDEGMRLFDEAMVELVSGTLSPIVTGTVYCSMIEACEEIAEYRRAAEWTETLTTWCERQEGMVTFNGQCLTHRATILRRQGRLDEAALEAEQAREAFAGAADRPATGRAWYERAEIHRLRGERSEAEAAYREAATWGHDPQPGLALLRMAEGNVRTAAAAMRRRVAEVPDLVDRVRLLPAHVDVMLAAGARDEAAAAAAELSRLAATYDTAALTARADFASGVIDLTDGEPGRALVRLRSAAAAWRSLHTPYEEARTRSRIAEACRALGDEETAALEEAAAAETFARLGAVDPTGEGEPSHPLSPRELQVLALVATGRTNQQIADELFLAVKTIERHVGNILMKLDVPSRTAATAYAYEHHLV